MGFAGWKNEETYLVNVWIGDDPYIKVMAETEYRIDNNPHNLGELLKDYIYAIKEKNSPKTASLFDDFINMAIESVDWVSLAKHYLKKAQLELEYKKSVARKKLID